MEIIEELLVQIYLSEDPYEYNFDLPEQIHQSLVIGGFVEEAHRRGLIQTPLFHGSSECGFEDKKVYDLITNLKLTNAGIAYVQNLPYEMKSKINFKG